MILNFISTLVALPILFVSLGITQNQDTYEVIKKPQAREIKAIYLTGYTSGWKARRDELIGHVEDTELNAVVIDIKDASGRVFFDTDLPIVDEIGSEEIRIPDLREWLVELKEKGIYTIARIVVMNDPYLASHKPEIALQAKTGGNWRDYKGQMWVDPTEQYVWDYNLDLAQEAVKIGFDEVNFDYIRFPSDGNIRNIVYSNLDKEEEKYDVMRDFYEYLNKRMSFVPAITSADLFGMTLVRHDGMNIGQRLEDAAPNFDFIAPMTYPSHYPDGYEGFANPADYPYEIIYRDMVKAQGIMEGKRAKLRPWLQDFDLGAFYGPDKIVAQIKAVNDGGGMGWFLWNASNNYTIAGLQKE